MDPKFLEWTVQAFRNRGWGLYEKKETIPESIAMGPVQRLRNGTEYMALPREGGIYSRIPFLQFEREIVLLEDDPLKIAKIRAFTPADRLYFTGIVPSGDKIMAINLWKTPIPLTVFLESLKNLPEPSIIKWDDVKTYDDAVELGDAIILSDLKIENPCKHLARKGYFFHFCNSDRPEIPNEINFSNPAHQRHLGTAELQLFCNGNFEKCIRYPP